MPQALTKVEELFKKKKIFFKYNPSKDHLITKCLFCGKKDHMYVNVCTGKWDCKVCGKAGTIKQIKYALGEKEFIRPVRDAYKTIDLEYVQKARMALVNDKKIMEYLTVERQLPEKLIHKYKLCLKEEAGNKWVGFPYVYKDQIVNIKWKCLTNGAKPYWEIKKSEGGIIVPYNVDIIENKKDIVVVEGEEDCISAEAYGYINVISLPSGASSSLDPKYVDEVGLFMLALDNDMPGQSGAKRLARLLGASRCKRVFLPKKDFNECRQFGLDKKLIEKAFENAEDLFESCIKTATDYKDLIKDINDKQLIVPIYTSGFEKFNKMLGGGLVEGKLYLFSGMSGRGKTTFSFNLAYNVAKTKPVLLLCPESSPEEIWVNLFSIHLNKALGSTKWTERDIERTQEYLSGKCDIGNIYSKWVGKEFDATKAAIDSIREGIYKGYKFFVVDHLRYLISGGKDSIAATDGFIRNLLHLCGKHKVTIWLVHQPRKLSEDKKQMDASDLYGSGFIEQSAYGIVLLHRDPARPNTELEIVKIRHKQGKEGALEFTFNMALQKYYEKK